MEKSNIFSELWVRLPTNKYPIIIGEYLLSDPNTLERCVTTTKVLVVTNTTIAPLYLAKVLAGLSRHSCDVVILEDGEIYKNQQSLFQIYTVLIDKGHHRDTTIIALGGGVVGDIAGFAASTYQRGVHFVQIPTTLLAQVDAAVGGKNAINFLSGKNSIGSFYQPNAIIMDIHLLTSLPLREFRAGLGEIIKYAILKGGTFLPRLQSALEKGLAFNAAHNLGEIIYKCCQFKAAYVEQDERESGARALLNLGHTLAHALESSSNYSRWLHGEAVAIGLYFIALLSYHRGTLDKKSVIIIDRLLEMAELPRRIPADVDLKVLRLAMEKDKKIKNNRLRFILIKRLGECYCEDNVSEADIQATLEIAVEGVNDAN